MARMELLVVANPYPPMASAGVNRVLRFLRYLPQHGWEPTVLAARASGPVAEPPGVPVVRVPVPMPRQLLGGGRRRTRVNAWIGVPDDYVSWVAPAAMRGHRLLAERRFDAVFSSSPRASVHLVAALLSRRTGLPWLADFRDPWTTSPFRTYPTDAHRALDARLEAWAMRRPAAVSAVNQPIADDLVTRYPLLAGRTHVVPNGFDPGEEADHVDLGPGFWFVHTGRLYGRDEQVHGFLTALAGLPSDVKALFVGIDGARLRAEARALGIEGRVHVEPFVPHRRALGCQRAADALLLVNGRGPESLSSKVFEYLQSGRPVFAISPDRCAARDLFDEVGGGVTVPPDAVMAGPLAAFVRAVREGRGPTVASDALRRYEYEALTAQLSALLAGLVEAPA
jgi:glycosyltransferase involved in cell wall biosynthesis